jgi:hypothetical protein
LFAPKKANMVSRIRKWVDDANVRSCYSCGVLFSFFTRKHHCRFCGRVFCSSCCSAKMVIPSLLQDELPLSPNDSSLYAYIKSHDSSRPRRVCAACQHHIHITKSVEQMIQVLLLCKDLTWKDYAVLAQVNNRWNTCIKEIRRLLLSARNVLPTMNLTPLEEKIVRLHASDLYQHVQWRVLVLRVCKGAVPLPPTCVSPCKFFGCTCSHGILIADAIEAAINWHHLPTMLDFSIDCFSRGIPKCFLTSLTFAASKSQAFFDRVVVPRLSNRDFVHAVAFRARAVQNLHLFQQIVQQSPFVKEIDASMELANVLLKLAATNVVEQRQKIVNNWQNHRSLEVPVFLPGQSEWLVIDIKWSKIVKKQSSTVPTLIPLMVQSSKSKHTTVLSILIKEESVLKDMIVMDVLNYICILYREQAIEYHVMNLTPDQGMLIIVPNSKTLQSISDESKMTLQNYLIEHNPEETVETLRKRFVTSCTIASVLSHLCGLGDRHMENILLHRSGHLFHIDFGFILGDEPLGKQRLSAVTMKLTPDIVDCIGGEHSQSFQDFKMEVSNLYNICRYHTKAFYYIFSPLVMTKSIQREFLIVHILEKFVPGESTRQAKIRIEECIARNTRERQLDHLFDMAHTIKSKWFQ